MLCYVVDESHNAKRTSAMSSAILIGSKNGRKLHETCFVSAKEKAIEANEGGGVVEDESDEEKEETRAFYA